MRIRLCEDRDLDAITRLNNWAIRTLAAHFAYDEIDVHETREQYLAGFPRYPWLVAEDESGFLGFARGGRWRAREAYSWTVELAVYVEPAAHGKGVGTALYSTLIEVCRLQGYCTVLGGVVPPNEASRRLHLSRGMSVVGTFPHVGHKMDGWRDVEYFAKVINEEPGSILPASADLVRRAIDAPGSSVPPPTS